MSNTAAAQQALYGELTYDMLFNEHSKLIFKLIYKALRACNLNLNVFEIDDIYQEVALKIFKNDYIGRYNGTRSSFNTWLGIICRTTTIDYYRKKVRWIDHELAGQEQVDTTAGLDRDFFSLLADVLTARQTQIITMLYRDDMNGREIADALGVSPRTVRSLKFQALERLRAHYNVAPPLIHADTDETPRRKVS